MSFTQLRHQARPKDHMGILNPLLPTKYAPLRPNGDGLQSIYLTELPQAFAEVLAGLIGAEAEAMLHQFAHRPSLQKMGVETEQPVTVGDFTSGQKKFLDFHRNSVLLMAVR